jgi:hypothetical protein
VFHIAATKTDTKAAASVAASATHSHEIDTLSYDFASIDVVFSPFTATTSSAASVLKIQQSDASGSGQADVSGFVGGTAFTVGAGSTTGANNGYVARFNLDLRGRKRYLTVVASPGNTVAVASVARLGRGEQAPIDSTTGNTNIWVSG